MIEMILEEYLEFCAVSCNYEVTQQFLRDSDD